MHVNMPDSSTESCLIGNFMTCDKNKDNRYPYELLFIN